jgi:hypothetical protein
MSIVGVLPIAKRDCVGFKNSSTTRDKSIKKLLHKQPAPASAQPDVFEPRLTPLEVASLSPE